MKAWDACADQPVPVGWAIGRGETYDNWDYQDQVDLGKSPDQIIRKFVARGRTEEQVQAVAAKYLDPSIAVTSYLLPAEQEASTP